jgi:hypothetical protein
LRKRLKPDTARPAGLLKESSRRRILLGRRTVSDDGPDLFEGAADGPAARGRGLRKFDLKLARKVQQGFHVDRGFGAYSVESLLVQLALPRAEPFSSVSRAGSDRLAGFLRGFHRAIGSGEVVGLSGDPGEFPDGLFADQPGTAWRSREALLKKLDCGAARHRTRARLDARVRKIDGILTSGRGQQIAGAARYRRGQAPNTLIGQFANAIADSVCPRGHGSISQPLADVPSVDRVAVLRRKDALRLAPRRSAESVGQRNSEHRSAAGWPRAGNRR